jgi:hypothetical protein
MSHSRTRFFLLGSAAVLVGGLAVGTAAYMGGLPMRAIASQAGPDDLALVPAGAAVVAYANVHDVMRSEFRQRLTAAVDNQGEGRQKFLDETGIDVEHDIDSVVAANIPGVSGARSGDFGFLALRGRFDTTKIEALVSAKGGRLDEYRGARLLLTPDRAATTDTDQPADSRHPHPVLALVSPNLVMVGSRDAVTAAIDRHHGDAAGNSILSDGAFVRMLGGLDDDSTAWVIGRSTALAGAEGQLPAPMAAQLPGVQWFAASGHVNGGLRAVLQAEAIDADAGRNLRELVQGVLALARLQSDSKPELKTLLQALQVEGSGTSVSVRVALPAEVLDLLIGQMAPRGLAAHRTLLQTEPVGVP